MIINIQNLLINFHTNRDKILNGVPKYGYGPEFSNTQTQYVENAINKSLGNRGLYVYSIEFLHEQHRNPYSREFYNYWGAIDTIPKYLECHILLYKNILRLKLNKPIMNLSEFNEEILREEEEKRKLIDKKKEKKRFRKEKRLEKTEEEKKQLKKEENEEKERLKEEVDNFIKNENCKKNSRKNCTISGGKNNTRKNRKTRKSK
jgi:hypothetical protein